MRCWWFLDLSQSFAAMGGKCRVRAAGVTAMKQTERAAPRQRLSNELMVAHVDVYVGHSLAVPA